MNGKKTLKTWVRDAQAEGKTVSGVLLALCALPESKAEVPVVGEPLAPVIWTGEQWAVTEYGIEARNGCYPIPADRLAEIDGKHTWVHQIAEKAGADARDFALAYVIACAVFEVRFSHDHG